MPKRVSSGPSRQPKRAKRRAPVPLAASSPSPLRAGPPQHPVGSTLRSAPVRERAPATPLVDYHYVMSDLKRVGLTTAAMFAVLVILAVFLR